MRGSFLAQIRTQGMAEDYITALERVSSPLMLVVMFAAAIAGAPLGAFLARRMFKKHLEKAGMV